MSGQKKKIIVFDILLLIVVAIALGVSMAFSRDIELKLGLLYYAEVSDADENETDGGEGSDAQRSANGVYASADGVYASADGGELYIHYLDVEQGDCTVIEFPDGKTMIIDAGKGYKRVQTAIQNFIDERLGSSFKYFDYAILTHPDDDHCGSLDYVLEKYPARVSYRPNVEATKLTGGSAYTDPAKDIINGANSKDTASYGDAIKAMYAVTPEFTSVVYVTDPADEEQTIVAEDNSYTFTFFSPLSVSYTDWNDYSPIMILSYNGFNFALSGDAEEINEREFVEKVQAAATDGVTDKYDIFTDTYTVNSIKCGHHGSSTSSSQGYLDAITTPDGARSAFYIISCGEGNSYHHPHQQTLDRLKNMGVPDDNILRTDKLGNITLSVRKNEAGEYTLFHGNTPARIVVTALVYRKLGSIELTWTVVAWSVYALIVVIVAAHIALTAAGVKIGGRRR